MHWLVRLIFVCLTAGSAAASDPEPVRFSHTAELRGVSLDIPMELYLTAPTETRLAIKLAGNLGDLQRALPRILSDVIEDTCRRRIAFEVQEGRAEGDRVRLKGRVQAILYRCRDEDRASRRRLLNNITEVDVLLDARIVDDCLRAELVRLDLDPSGLAGFALNITGLTTRISTRVVEGVNATLRDQDTCIDLPEALKAVDARLESGGFRDFGGGEMGFVVKAGVTVTARRMIALMDAVDARNLFDDRDPCPCR